MEFFVGLLIQYGYVGMLLAAFLAGSFFPFSSEAVMVGLLAAGLSPTELCIYATIGNVVGGMFNYGVGRMGKTEWIEKYLHVKKKDLDRAERFMAGRGAWMGFFAFLPLLGSAITILLGLMRANIFISFTSITIGKALRYVLLALGMGAFVLSSCSEKRESNRLQVTVTIEPLRFFAEEIGGDRVRVITIVPQESSAETYEPTARQMVELSKSQLYVSMGSLGFEERLTERLQGSSTGLTVIKANDGLQLIKAHNHSLGEEMCHHDDPHTWTNPKNAKIIARNICKALTKVDRHDSLLYANNLHRLCQRIDSLDAQIARQVDSARQAGFPAAFLIYHPALTYYAMSYGLTQIAIEENGHEPSPLILKRQLTNARQHGVNTLLLQQSMRGSNISVICKDAGVNMVEINPLNYHWFEEIKRITNAICQKQE